MATMFLETTFRRDSLAKDAPRIKKQAPRTY